MSKHRASPYGSAPRKPDPNHQPKHRGDQHVHWWMRVGDGPQWKCVRIGCGVLTDKTCAKAWSA